MDKHIDVASVCNALIDIVVESDDKDLTKFGLNKGTMHLVDSEKQRDILGHFEKKVQTIELGGSAMNAMRALAGLGLNTAFAGMVGPDNYGQRIKDRMAHLKIDAHLGETEKEPTGTCLVLVDPKDGERTMVTCLGASRLYDHTHIPSAAIEKAKVFHFCGYQWDTDNQKQGINEAIQIAKDAKTAISFDVADPFVVGAHQDDFLKLIEKEADIVFANKEEAKLLYNLSPKETAKRIADKGSIAVIKLGAEGALVRKGQEEFRIEPVGTTVIDTTAAGDMFAGGFLFGFVQGKSLDECGKIAATLASDVISRFGAILSDSVLTEVKKV